MALPARFASFISPYFCCALLLAGCSSTPENPITYSNEAANTIEQENTRLFQATSSNHNVQLPDLIPDPALNELIQKALAGNPNVQKTALALEASRLSLTSTRSNQLPEASASLSDSISEGSQQKYNAGISVSWELDLWARLADATSAAEKNLASEHELFLASQSSLAGNVMKQWLQLISNQHAISIEQDRLALLETNETLIVQRFRNGLGTLESLDEAKTATSQSRASLAEYQEALASNLRTLNLLLGDNNTQPFTIPSEYPSVLLDIDDLPNQDLAQRPDLKAAYLSIEAAEYSEKVAYKDMLPSLSLSAALDSSSQSLHDALFSSPVWSLLGQLSAPLFNGGKLKAEHEIAGLAIAQSYQSYRDTLLTAVNEVENAIGQEKVLNAQVLHIQNALASAQSNRQQYERKYRSGLVELSDLLNAQQTVFDLQSSLDTLRYQLLSNRVDLGLSLGLGVSPQ